jgi:hypothetical protein
MYPTYFPGQPDTHNIPIIKDPKIKCAKMEKEQNECSKLIYWAVIDPEMHNHFKM